MTFNHFIKLMLITMLGLLLVLVPIHFVKGIKPFVDLTVILVAFFVLLSVGVYFLGERFSRSKNKYQYNQLIILNFVFKLGVSIGILVIYNSISQPESNLFVVPFGIIYLAFTIFEAIFMSKQAGISE